MQFYLLLLSGLISGSTVLAQEAIGYDGAECTGRTILSVKPSCTLKCKNTASSDIKSMDLSQNVDCLLFEDPDCTGLARFINNLACSPVTLKSVGSFRCYKNLGC
jgi:hypothetical protein